MINKWIVLILIVAFFGKYLMDAGIFRRIETQGLDKCRLIVPAGGGNLFKSSKNFYKSLL